MCAECDEEDAKSAEAEEADEGDGGGDDGDAQEAEAEENQEEEEEEEAEEEDDIASLKASFKKGSAATAQTTSLLLIRVAQLEDQQKSNKLESDQRLDSLATNLAVSKSSLQSKVDQLEIRSAGLESRLEQVEDAQVPDVEPDFESKRFGRLEARMLQLEEQLEEQKSIKLESDQKLEAMAAKLAQSESLLVDQLHSRADDLEARVEALEAAQADEDAEDESDDDSESERVCELENRVDSLEYQAEESCDEIKKLQDALRKLSTEHEESKRTHKMEMERQQGQTKH